jgi:hypothetical protein
MRIVPCLLALALATPTLACPLAGGAAAAARDEAFAQADANGDGALGREEFATFRERMRETMAARLFDRLDADDDGAVSKAEVDAFKGKGHGRRHGRGGPG